MINAMIIRTMTKKVTPITNKTSKISINMAKSKTKTYTNKNKNKPSIMTKNSSIWKQKTTKTCQHSIQKSSIMKKQSMKMTHTSTNSITMSVWKCSHREYDRGLRNWLIILRYLLIISLIKMKLTAQSIRGIIESRKIFKSHSPYSLTWHLLIHQFL